MNNEELKEQLKKEIRQEIKQEQKKKKRIKCIIILVILFIIAGVIAISVHNAYKKQYANSSQSKNISREEFSHYLTELPPITTDNWDEYLILEYETVEDKNIFGEITSTTKPYLKLKENIVGYEVLLLKAPNNLCSQINDDVSIHYIKSSSNELHLLGLKENIKLTINDIICTKATGKLYTINLPESIWQLDSEGKKYFELENIYYFEDDYINKLCNDIYFNAKS